MASRRRVEKMPTAAGLERSAQWHLSRRSWSEDQLRQALLRKLQRAQRAQLVFDMQVMQAAIESLLVRYRAALLLDDAKVAVNAASSLRAAGKSERVIRQKLQARGIDSDIVSQSLVTVDGDQQAGAADLEAARVFVRKKRLRDKDPQKALASLARQGFSFATAKAALSSSES
jgi:regulatory protein